ncbi:MAG: putative signal peptidase [Chloroflexi bacterium]|nr:putative signal peptidase [Chloroflexota bacterium]
MTQKPAVGCLLEVLETLVLTVVIFFGIQTFVAQPFKVQQGSMENTLLPEQYVLVDKLSPRWDAYSLGDIVVFEPPASSSQGSGVPFIKRVIGVGGDIVEVRDGLVYVNGVRLDEPYIFRGTDGVQQQTLATPGGATRWVVPEGALFLMGDHREDSADSRSFGTIEVAHVVGRAWLRYWPFDELSILEVPLYPELASPAP